MAKSKVNFICNDCDRGFIHESAWQYHGAQTGHNINGDLPGHQQKEIDELATKLNGYKAECECLQKECKRLSQKLNAIISVVQL